MQSGEAIERIWAAIEAERDYAVELTRDLVRIPTVNPKFVNDADLNREPEHQAHLAAMLGGLGFGTELLEVSAGRPNLVATWPGNEARSLILCGHVDVVPEGERSLWTHDPFEGVVADGRIFGRGALDMKGGIAACAAAAKAIRDAGLTLDGRLDIHAVVDEEAGGFGALDLIRRGHLAKAAIVAEATWGAVQPVEGGLDWVRVTLRGKIAHAGWRYNAVYPQTEAPARPISGVNAFEKGVKFIAAVQELERDWGRRKYHPLLPPGITTINPGVMIAGAGIGEDGRPQVLTNPAIIPDTCVIEFDLKFLPGEDKQTVRREFEDFVHHWAAADSWLSAHPPKVEWEIGGLHFPPVSTPPDHALVQSMLGARQRLGHAPELGGYIAVSDAAHYAGAGVDCVIFGPSGDGYHAADEHVEIDSLIDCTKVIATAIVEWCGIRE
ncbi:MAG TPA: ArgE/DapE family deacylase [Alphaproteobacteria bacterium]|nr:ArgE/DapE family deacylase [Alphaproteobacteria bacterium]HJN59624.1 ArgE/DapE family deacylase [Alphaproteobacteria bacterium]